MKFQLLNISKLLFTSAFLLSFMCQDKLTAYENNNFPHENPILYDTTQLDSIKTAASKNKTNEFNVIMQNIGKAADKLLKVPPYSVTQKTINP